MITCYSFTRTILYAYYKFTNISESEYILNKWMILLERVWRQLLLRHSLQSRCYVRPYCSTTSVIATLRSRCHCHANHSPCIHTRKHHRYRAYISVRIQHVCHAQRSALNLIRVGMPVPPIHVGGGRKRPPLTTVIMLQWS